MAFEVTIPEVGESITEGFLAEWSQPDGAVVAIDDPLLVLETDKITLTVSAEQAGTLHILVAEGETVNVGQVVATIDPNAATQIAPHAPSAKAIGGALLEKVDGDPAAGGESPDLDELTPAVRRLVLEHEIDSRLIAGTGKNGRILKGDVLRYVAAEAESEQEVSSDPEPPTETAAEPSESPPSGPQAVDLPDRRQTREPMSRLRRRLAERLVEVQRTAAILTTFNEVDMSRVIELRRTYKEAFEKRHGIGLGFMSFFVKASVDALKNVPEVNAYIDGDEIVTNHYYDIGVAVSSDKGLVVPVIRNAERLSPAAIERAIADLALRARERRLDLADLSGAVFTISNGGIFGSLQSTPILNPPGSAILGMHAIKKRPVVIDDEIVIRPMMYLAMSYDHRIIDGREAVTFLKRIVDCIENPERLMLEI